MKFLFVHQNFPGQYRQLVDWLIARGGHEIVFLTQRRDVPANLGGLTVVTYRSHHRPAAEAYALSRHFEECVGAGFAVAQACHQLDRHGFVPDIILGHVGWGELTFTRQVWPDVPVLGYFEYYFRTEGGATGFDPEFPADEITPFVLRARNAMNHLNIESCDLGQTPTRWQHDTFPESFHAKLYCCHDGIRTDRLVPGVASVRLGRLDAPLTRDDEIVTYMARNMEPTRGFHVFMRALPALLEARPAARVLIIGGNESSYGAASRAEGGYRSEMERELGDRIDWSRVHFLGRVPYRDYLDVIRISRCHVYLTMPFVLSWSLLEAMSLQATIVASDTAPVREVIRHGETGLLVDFFSPEALARQVAEVLARPDDHARLGPAARAHVQAHHDFRTCTLPVHLERINALVPRDLRMASPG